MDTKDSTVLAVIVAITVLVTMLVIATVALAIYRPEGDNNATLTPVVGIIGAIALQLFNLIRTEQTSKKVDEVKNSVQTVHATVNGRMDQMLAEAEERGRQLGIAQSSTEQRRREDQAS